MSEGAGSCRPRDAGAPEEPSETRSVGLTAVCGIVLLASSIGIWLQGDLRQQVPVFFVFYGAGLLAYAVSSWLHRRLHLGMVLAVGLLVRLPMLVTAPSLSDDVYRYAWDGRVQVEGINPYRYAPNATDLAFLRDAVIHPQVNHPELPTIYPPFAQAVFAICARTPSPVAALKLVAFGAEIACALLLLGLLRAYSQPAEAVVLFLWHPLVFLEGTGHAHIDALGAMLVIATVLYAQVGRGGRAGVALAAATLAKLLPLVFVVPVWRWLISRRVPSTGGRPAAWLRGLRTPEGYRFPILYGVVCVAAYVVYSSPGVDPLGSLGPYMGRWEFNALPFDMLRSAVGGYVARLCLAALFVGLVFFLTLSHLPAAQCVFVITGGYLILTPTLHPWYGLWLIPFLPLYRSPGWAAFTGLLPAAYAVLTGYTETGVWIEPAWSRWIPVLGAIGAAAIARILAGRERRRGPQMPPIAP